MFQDLRQSSRSWLKINTPQKSPRQDHVGSFAQSQRNGSAENVGFCDNGFKSRWSYYCFICLVLGAFEQSIDCLALIFEPIEHVETTHSMFIMAWNNP